MVEPLPCLFPQLNLWCGFKLSRPSFPSLAFVWERTQKKNVCVMQGGKGGQAFSSSSVPCTSMNSCNASNTKNDMGTCSQIASPGSSVAHLQECFS